MGEEVGDGVAPVSVDVCYRGRSGKKRQRPQFSKCVSEAAGTS